MAKSGMEVALQAYSQAADITLADTDISLPYDAIFVGGTGNLKVRDMNDNDATLNGLVAGSIIPLRCKRLWSTGSTASGTLKLVGLRF